jgi:hypothetical protein
MPGTDAKILCRTPTPGKAGTRIDRWKYDAVRRAILKVVPRGGDGVAFRDLPRLVGRALPAAERRRLGSVSWYTTTVKLDLEVRGEIARVPGARPQRLQRTAQSPRRKRST